MSLPRIALGLMMLVLAGAMAFTAPKLIRDTRIGLEFRGGYEILFAAAPLEGNGPLEQGPLLEAAKILGQRANLLGVSEPEIQVESGNLIRVKLAGITDVSGLRESLTNPAGLPLKIVEKYSETVGGVLGQADLSDTMTAGGVALGVIFLAMLAMYRGPGFIAVFNLTVYFWLLLVVFNLLHAVLSLAAIVAFVLGVGIAAGTNILSFEWIKEELRNGLPFHEALRRGQNLALRTILDANGTVLLSSIILFAAGPGTVQGFALTMMLSILVSLAVNLGLTRLFLSMLYADRPVARTALLRDPNDAPGSSRDRTDFLRWRRIAVAASIAIVVIGMGFAVFGEINYDIDFKAGTALDIKLPQPTDQERATSIMTDAGIAPATVAIGGSDRNLVAARFDDVLDAAQIGQIVDVFRQLDGPDVAFEENTADPIVARQLAIEAVYAILLALAGSFLFILWRFDWRTSVAAMLAVANSVLFVMSMFAIFGLEIDVTFIAAILTVIGYSLNETVIVFDRLRQNRAAGVADPAERMNLSIRQTLRRSVYTVSAVAVGAVSLFLLGAEPLQMFSLAIFLGLLCGAFSSIFIAPGVWYRLSRGAGMRQAGAQPA